MSGFDLTAANNILKEYYTPEQVQTVVADKNPFYALLKKRTDWEGDMYHVPVVNGDPQGISASFSQAQARSLATYSDVEKFTLTRVPIYGVAVIDGQAIRATQGKTKAFLEATTLTTDGMARQLANRLSSALFRDGSGKLATMQNSSFSTSVVTLTSSSDSVNINAGQEFDLVSSGGTVRAHGSNGHGLYVGSVDRNAGTFVVVNASGTPVNISDSADGIPTATQFDNLVPRGDASMVLPGTEAWIPFTRTGLGTAFNGVTRSKDPSRLAGQYLDASNGVPLEEALIDGASVVDREGGTLSHYFINHKKFANLVKSLSSKRELELVDVDTDVGIGFRGINLATASGNVQILADRNCPVNRAFGLSLKDWEMVSMGEPIGILDEDGLQMIRSATADSYEMRWGGFLSLANHAPAHNVVINLSGS